MIIKLNQLEPEKLRNALHKCCGSERWVSLMLGHFPFEREQALFLEAKKSWYQDCSELDWKEAFTHHPKIGDLESLAQKFKATKKWSESEQAGVNADDRLTLKALAKGNQDYEKKFGYIFIVCATGKTAIEMLALLKERLSNSPEEEILIAMEEQHKITTLRLKKLVENLTTKKHMSQITTHVLDTSSGRPAAGMFIELQASSEEGDLETIASGVTHTDGRINDLLLPEVLLRPGAYRLVFHTGAYFALMNQNGFYPQVELVFSVTDDSHYHVPLLLSPFGYSTYRGS